MSETTQEKVFATNIQAVLAREFAIKPWQVENTVALLDEGATIPFIARYFVFTTLYLYSILLYLSVYVNLL